MYMHKIKNKKLLSILMSCMISYTCLSIDNIYANENSDKLEVDNSVEDTNETTQEENNTDTDTDNSENSSESELKEILVNDINNTENVGLNIKTKGNIIKIEDDKIYIKDESGEGIVYIQNISVNNLKIGDCISVIGIVNKIEDINVVIVNDVNNIDLVITEGNVIDESNKEDNKTEDNLVEDENKDNITSDKNNKPNKPSDNKGQTKPGNSVNLSKPSANLDASKPNIEEIVVNSIKAKDEVVIENDLTSQQWEKVKLALEEKLIKVKDLKNNKIRITQVNKELGDNIWIVNDPRMLDLEETKTIGTEIAKTVQYFEYDVSESKWNTIVADVESGSAKIKYDSDKNIKVIYKKGKGKDDTITLNKIETEEE